MQATIPRPRLPAVAVPVAGFVWAVAFGLGLAGVVMRLTTGHEHAGYGSYIPWGLWVAGYVYFIGLSAGAFLISSLVYVFGMRRLERIGKLALFTALVTLIVALLAIWMDLGHMERVWNVYVHGNPHSMMAWMVWMYTAYFLLILSETWFAMRSDLARMATAGGLLGRVGRLLTLGRGDTSAEAAARDRAWLRVLGTIGVPLAIAFHGGVGALFGVIAARPFWNAAIYPIGFIVGALTSGGALLTVVVAFFWPGRRTLANKELVTFLGRFVLGLLFFYLLVEWAEYSIGLLGGVPGETEPYDQVLTGSYWWVFWFVHIGIGTVIPIALLAARPRSVPVVGIAAALIAITFIAVRLNVVIPGLIAPPLEGLETAFVDERLGFEYFPTLMEWLVLVFFGALGVGLFYLGTKLLPLTTREEK